MEAYELNEILDQHKLWLETNGMQGKRANLYCADLTDADLRGADLSDAFLGGAYLSGAYLSGASLVGADLNGANLWRADLNGASLRYANLTGSNLEGASLTKANLTAAYLTGAYLQYANLSNAILPDISWIIPGCLVQLNHVMGDFYLEKKDKWENFVQDSFGFIIQNNGEEGTFDMLLGDRIIRSIPHWVKLSGLKQIASESV